MSRINYFDEKADAAEVETMLTKILDGTHVMINSPSNFFIKFYQLPEERKCDFPGEKFYFSREPISVQSTSWLINKRKKNLTELINQHLLWLQETGLYRSFSLKNPEQGIETHRKIEPGCPKTSQTVGDCPSTPTSTRLTVGHLTNAFQILLLGQMISLLVFALELAVNNFFKRCCSSTSNYAV